MNIFLSWPLKECLWDNFISHINNRKRLEITILHRKHKKKLSFNLKWNCHKNCHTIWFCFNPITLKFLISIFFFMKHFLKPRSHKIVINFFLQLFMFRPNIGGLRWRISNKMQQNLDVRTNEGKFNLSYFKKFQKIKKICRFSKSASHRLNWF